MGGSKQRTLSYLAVNLITCSGYCRPCVDGGRIGEITQVNEVTVLSTHDNVQPLPESMNAPIPDIST